MTTASPWRGTMFGLLHVSTHQQQHANLRSQRSSLDVYLGCAALCSRTMASAGQAFSVITNAPDLLARRGEALGLPTIPFAPYEFRWSVPRDLRFHSAHYKLEIFQAFAEGRFGTHVGLVDIDTVLFRPFSTSPPPGGLVAYDISAQYLDLARDRVRADLERIAGRPLTSPRWFGGELIYGDSTAFSRLHGQVAALWPRYLDLAPGLDHVGDEAIVSAALNILAADGLDIVDAGVRHDVARWWSGRTGHRQESFAHAQGTALLHLPSDKVFLAKAARRIESADSLRVRYRRHMIRRLAIQRAAALYDAWRGRTRRHVPRLS